MAFEFVNGFHDTANAVATVIYTKALNPMIAIPWSGAKKKKLVKTFLNNNLEKKKNYLDDLLLSGGIKQLQLWSLEITDEKALKSVELFLKFLPVSLLKAMPLY